MKYHIFMIVILYYLLSVVQSESQYPDPCDHPIYCKPGPHSVLHVVQMARIFKDSKTFVDMPMKKSQNQILAAFNLMMKKSNNDPSKDQVQTFVDENFDKEGTEFEDWEPKDWTENPAVLNKITDPDYKAFATDIHKRWKDLGRKIKTSLANSDRTSLMYLKEPFIVPGGRFREMYYWDSYWTIIGLLKSEMKDTVKGMLENFIDLVKLNGFIPNGNRIYYTRRSQPPLFISMVDEYYKGTNDWNFTSDNLIYLEKEFQHWMVNRTIDVTKNGKDYKLAVYNVEIDAPRPESYYEDYHDAEHFSSESEKVEFYINIKSGAESGWDYSTKWFVDSNGEMSENLVDIKARHIIPVELNSYLCRNSRILSEYFERKENPVKARHYSEINKKIMEAIEEILWNNEEGTWFDYDTLNGKQRKYFFPSNIAPLWADCYTQTRLKEKINSIVNYLNKNKAMTYPGGVPTSNTQSGQQWDFPNGWAPLHELMVTGLENSGDPEAQKIALSIVKKWVKNNWVSYEQSEKSIFEKFDVSEVGLPGGGGEYDIQEGFGWTNGVLLDFFDKYGDKISTQDTFNGAYRIQFSLWLIGIVILLKILN